MVIYNICGKLVKLFMGTTLYFFVTVVTLSASIFNIFRFDFVLILQ